MRKVWFDEAWEDYIYWQTQDKKTLKRKEQKFEPAALRFFIAIAAGSFHVIACGSYYCGGTASGGVSGVASGGVSGTGGGAVPSVLIPGIVGSV